MACVGPEQALRQPAAEKPRPTRDEQASPRRPSQSPADSSSTWSRSAARGLATQDLSAEVMERLDHRVHHDRRDARIDADPEGLVHDDVRPGQLADLAVPDVRVGRLPEEVPGEDLPGADLPG